MTPASTQRQFSLFENWPGWFFNIPVGVCWLMLALRYRSVMLLSVANPRLPLGGLCNESKTLLLRALGPTGIAYLAPFMTLEPEELEGDNITAYAEEAMHKAGLSYPIVAKPDIGRNGTGVQVVRDSTALAHYLSTFPRGAALLLQKFIADPGEAGVFYIRGPGEPAGRIVSLTIKHFPVVVGDGVRTLRDLILADPRAGQLTELYFPRFNGRLNEVPAPGEVVQLVSVGNHAKGAVFEDGARFITPQMEERFEQIAREMPDFRFGRFDVRYSSLEELKQGTGFSIVEYNGASSEPTHILDRTMTLTKAYGDYFAILSVAFALGNEYRAQGWRPATFREVFAAQRAEWKLLARYPQGKEY